MQYFQGATEVTNLVTSGQGWKRPHVPPDARRGFSVKVTPKSGLSPGQTYAVWVRAEAGQDPAQRDVIYAITVVKE